jgi:hypothetical protein
LGKIGWDLTLKKPRFLWDTPFIIYLKTFLGAKNGRFRKNLKQFLFLFKNKNNYLPLY